MHFQIFFFASKKVQGFSSDWKILMSVLLVLFYLQNRVSQFSEILILARIFGETYIMSLKTTTFPKDLW